jgi:dihydrofolate synthase/folylpolyglutamate synthase
LDHQQWLGNTSAEIASEKAGIIKAGIPTITAASEPAAISVITQTARKLGSPLILVGDSDTQKAPLVNIDLPLLGAHQRLNAALALATVKALSGKRPIAAPTILNGLQQVEWAGRMQVIKTPDDRNLILDGAHNPAGIQILKDAFIKLFPTVRPALILGILKDKDWESMCKIIAPIASRLYLTPVHSDRSATPDMLGFICRQANPALEIVQCSSVAETLKLSERESHVLCAGSLYLIGEVLDHLHITVSNLPGEQNLNEWQLKQPVINRAAHQVAAA